MLVMDEAFDCWSGGKNPDDYHLYFDQVRLAPPCAITVATDHAALTHSSLGPPRGTSAATGRDHH